MKNIALIFLISIAFANCKSVESQQVSNSNINTESNSVKVEPTPITEESIPSLTKKQQQTLDKMIPPKIKEILDKTDEIDIYYNIDKETKGLRVLWFDVVVPNAGATISDATLKKRFLDNFYYDIATNDGGAACFSPRHKITAKYNNKTIELNICYQCGNFEGTSSYGKFAGAFPYKSKSSLIMNEIIEKYGTDLQ